MKYIQKYIYLAKFNNDIINCLLVVAKSNFVQALCYANKNLHNFSLL